jgi:DNA-binding MarR family transcriptional regulator
MNRSRMERLFVKSICVPYNLAVEKRGPRAEHPRSTAFLLAQVGARAAGLFALRLRELDLIPAHAGALRAIAANVGISQQALASLLGMVPSRLVGLLDELEQRGLVERRDSASDRRVYAIHLTDKGAKAMADIRRVAGAHDDEVCAPLTEKQRETLHSLLTQVADAQKLTPGVHPGFAHVGRDPRTETRGEATQGPPRAGRSRRTTSHRGG